MPSCAIAGTSTASAKRISRLLHDRERVVGGVQRLRASIVGDDRDVLDTHAEAAGEVNAGLDGERHTRAKRLGVPRDEVRMLVAVEADPVPGPMDEVRAVSG